MELMRNNILKNILFYLLNSSSNLNLDIKNSFGMINNKTGKKLFKAQTINFIF